MRYDYDPTTHDLYDALWMNNMGYGLEAFEAMIELVKKVVKEEPVE